MSQVINKEKKEQMYPCIYEDRFAEIDKKLGILSSIEQSIKNIEIGLVGSENLGIPGVIKRVDKHSKTLITLQRIVYIGMGIGLAFLLIWNIYQGIK